MLYGPYLKNGLRYKPMLPHSDIRIIAVEQYGAGPHGTIFLEELGYDAARRSALRHRGAIH